jgi:hypothetical protein
LFNGTLDDHFGINIIKWGPIFLQNSLQIRMFLSEEIIDQRHSWSSTHPLNGHSVYLSLCSLILNIIRCLNELLSEFQQFKVFLEPGTIFWMTSFSCIDLIVRCKFTLS